MKTLKEFNCWNHFQSWDGWTCNLCGELIESDERALIEHLLNKHKISFKE